MTAKTDSRRVNSVRGGLALVGVAAFAAGGAFMLAEQHYNVARTATAAPVRFNVVTGQTVDLRQNISACDDTLGKASREEPFDDQVARKCDTQEKSQGFGISHICGVVMFRDAQGDVADLPADLQLSCHREELASLHASGGDTEHTSLCKGVQKAADRGETVDPRLKHACPTA